MAPLCQEYINRTINNMSRRHKNKAKKVLIETNISVVVKLALYLLVGTLWISKEDKNVFPIGVILGYLIARKELFQIDKKIEFAMLVIGAFLSLHGIGLSFSY